MSSWYIYIVSCRDSSLYTGITTDVQRRIEQHNNGSGAKYTRSRRPVILVAHVQVDTKSEALKLEYNIKQLRRDKKIEALISYGKHQEISTD